MSIIKIINSIYASKELTKELLKYLGKTKTENVLRDDFLKFVKDNHFDIYPSVLFDFFDTLNIKISITPVGITEFWAIRIVVGSEITISNDHISRLEATLGALQKAITIYKQKKENEKQDEKQD